MEPFVADDLDNAPGGFVEFSDEGIILKINTTLAEILACPDKEHLIGKSIESVFTVAGRIFYQTHFFPLLKLQGKAEEIYFRLKTTDGGDLPVICNAVRRLNAGKASNHCLFIPALQRTKYEQELLTARKRADEALMKNQELLAAKAELEHHAYELDRRLVDLKQMNEDLVQFGKVISHDVQEPIRKIAIFTDRVAAETKGGLSEQILEQFKKINRECVVLRKLTDNLEKFISLNLHTDLIGLVNLNECISIAFQTATEDSDDCILTFNGGPLPVINGFERQLELLFYNIFRNSWQYRHDNRRLEIGVEQVVFQQNVFQETKGRYRYVDFIKIAISDNGLGFDYNPVKNYFRIERKSAPDAIGLTFGLAFCKKVVDSHHGFITIASAAGEGTMVTISLPISFSDNRHAD